MRRWAVFVQKVSSWSSPSPSCWQLIIRNPRGQYFLHTRQHSIWILTSELEPIIRTTSNIHSTCIINIYCRCWYNGHGVAKCCRAQSQPSIEFSAFLSCFFSPVSSLSVLFPSILLCKETSANNPIWIENRWSNRPWNKLDPRATWPLE